MPNPVIHFEIQAEDCQRAKRFYEGAFGWTFEPWGPPDFWRIHTSPGGIFGALTKRREPVTGTGMIGYECTIAVDDIEAATRSIAEHGGVVAMQPFVIENVGTLAKFVDPEGNVAGVMQYVEGILT